MATSDSTASKTVSVDAASKLVQDYLDKIARVEFLEYREAWLAEQLEHLIRLATCLAKANVKEVLEDFGVDDSSTLSEKISKLEKEAMKEAEEKAEVAMREATERLHRDFDIRGYVEKKEEKIGKVAVEADGEMREGGVSE